MNQRRTAMCQTQLRVKLGRRASDLHSWFCQVRVWSVQKTVRSLAKLRSAFNERSFPMRKDKPSGVFLFRCCIHNLIPARPWWYEKQVSDQLFDTLYPLADYDHCEVF